MNEDLKCILNELNTQITALDLGKNPSELYAPIQYLMSIGGKRLRPLLVVMGYKLLKNDWQEILLPALTVEVFHNFTLMHDDIMDEAPLRRGKETVHTKWDNNTAILSGDVMLVSAYRLLLLAPPTYLSVLLGKFNDCAAEVCEGQQLDMNYESIPLVSEVQYIEMIRQKTAVLLGFSLEMGAIMAGASKTTAGHLRNIGVLAGIGFQLKDDLLDVYGDQEKFGKQIGGDIIANKKTYLLIEALELAEGDDKVALEHWLSLTTFDKEEKVKAIIGIYDRLGIKAKTLQKMHSYFDQAFKLLEELDVPMLNNKLMLKAFLEYLINRDQ